MLGSRYFKKVRLAATLLTTVSLPEGTRSFHSQFSDVRRFRDLGAKRFPMALGQVRARTEGDVYQGLFFWRQAAELLRQNRSMVERVDLEHDEASGVDDVAVFYADPGVNAGSSGMVLADYFQLKYHVDNRASYSSTAIIDPSFIRSASSMLQRFYDAYKNLSKTRTKFRLHLASNWRWKDDDKLACLLREYDGALPSKFFDGGPLSDLGRIREEWRNHLGLDIEEFVAFARTLRFQLNHFGRRDFKDYVYKTLEAVGLRTPNADRAACPYESLIQQFIMNGPSSFDEASLRDLCERERLLIESRPKEPKFTIGIRSFVRFAERLESEVDELVCVSDQFEGRHPSSEDSWKISTNRVLGFLSDAERRAKLRCTDCVIALESHGSFALLAGWELSRNSGSRVAPIQKPGLDVWRPDEEAPVDASWISRTVDKESMANDVAICLSVTREVYSDVEEFLSSPGAPPIRRIVILTPNSGTSPKSIKDATQAHHLAIQLPGVLNEARTNRRDRVHLFFACPNALMFFIGQQREALGRLSLYEFDFGFEREGSYERSISLPVEQESDFGGSK